MDHEKSCGAIPFMRTSDGIKYLLITHIRQISGHTDFPKGHVEPGESEEQTAARETFEETGVHVRIITGYREEFEYCPQEGICKQVVFFVGEVQDTGGKICDDHVAKCGWYDFEEAVEKLTYGNARDILRKADSFLKNFK